MELDRLVADAETRGDGLVRQAVGESGEYRELTAGHWLHYGLVLMGRRRSDKVAIHIAQPARLGQRVGFGHDLERLGQLAP